MISGNAIAMKAVLLLICWVSVSSAQAFTIGQECKYSQNLDLGTVYYIYNPQYPNRYLGYQSCSWTMRSNYRVNLTCTGLEIPWSNNCTQDRLLVEINSNTTNRYCGEDKFTVLSDSDTMVVKFKSAFFSLGGRYLCQAQAVKYPLEFDNCRCGWKNPSRIVGGTNAGVNEFPMMAGVVYAITRELFCGASIISRKYVVTAGHCMENRNFSALAVVVGEHDISTGDDTNATQLFRVRTVIVHPNYVTGARENDIAILEVDGEIKYTMKVGPVCLPFQHSQDSFAGDYVDILGWGLTEFGGPRADILQKAVVSVITNRQCSKTYPQISSEQLCTYAPGKDSCQMDSGGPVLWQNPTTQNLVLTAIISNGISCGEEAGVNQRVGPYVDWILHVTPGTTYCAVE